MTDTALGGARPAEGSKVDDARRVARRTIQRVRCQNRVVSRGLNLVPTIQHRTSPRPLSPTADGVAANLRRDGVTTVPVWDLLGPDAALFDEVAQSVRTMCSDQAEAIAGQRAALLEGATAKGGKAFLVELMGKQPQVTPDDPILRFALHEQVRGVAERYAGCRLRVHDVNAWLNLASPLDASASQRWHRDLPEDSDIVKCFLYIDDVPLAAGPLEYIRGSNSLAGRRTKLASEWDGIGYRVVEDEMFDVFGRDSTIRAEGPRGTVAFADTLGLHRGGWAKTQDRLVVQILFATRACDRRKVLRAAPGYSPSDLPDVRLARAS